jgi:hypothetical protein
MRKNPLNYFSIGIILIVLSFHSEGVEPNVIQVHANDTLESYVLDAVKKLTFTADGTVLTGVGASYRFDAVNKITLKNDPTAAGLSGIHELSEPRKTVHFRGTAAEITLSRPSRVSIEVYDTKGRLLKVIYRGVLGGGTSKLPIHKSSEEWSASGFRFIECTIDGKRTVHTVIEP